ATVRRAAFARGYALVERGIRRPARRRVRMGAVIIRATATRETGVRPAAMRDADGRALRRGPFLAQAQGTDGQRAEERGQRGFHGIVSQDSDHEPQGRSVSARPGGASGASRTARAGGGAAGTASAPSPWSARRSSQPPPTARYTVIRPSATSPTAWAY